MAETLPIQGGPETARVRTPWGVVGLMIATLGAYGLYWWYEINREMADLGRKNGGADLGERPVLSLLAVLPSFLVLPAVVLAILDQSFAVPAIAVLALATVTLICTTITTFQRAKRAQELVGIDPRYLANPWVYGTFYLMIPLASYAYLQVELNKVWRASSA